MIWCIVSILVWLKCFMIFFSNSFTWFSKQLAITFFSIIAFWQIICQNGYFTRFNYFNFIIRVLFIILELWLLFLSIFIIVLWFERYFLNRAKPLFLTIIVFHLSEITICVTAFLFTVFLKFRQRKLL